MSRALPLSAADRIANYQAQTRELTPAQRRRVRHKANDLLRGHARTGRLRRRFDRKDQREVKSVVSELVSIVRARKAAVPRKVARR